MKNILFSLLLVAAVASAEEVKVSGYGRTYDSALESAKVAALEKGASTFIIGENNARNGRVTEQIDQYNGGIITKYDVVNQRATPNGYEVTIIADVVPKNNTVKRVKTPFAVDFDEYEQRERVVKRLDNVSSAIYAQVTNYQSKIGRYQTTVSANVTLGWQPKWVTDMKSFSSVVNERGRVTNNLYSSASASAISTLMTNFGVVGAVGGVVANNAVAPAPVQNSQQQMVCFGEYAGGGVDCNVIGVDLNFPRSPKLVLVANVDGRHVVLYQQILDMQMYKFVYPGERMSTSSLFSTYKVQFHNPALLVYEQERQTFSLTFNVDNSIIKSASEVAVYLE